MKTNLSIKDIIRLSSMALILLSSTVTMASTTHGSAPYAGPHGGSIHTGPHGNITIGAAYNAQDALENRSTTLHFWDYWEFYVSVEEAKASVIAASSGNPIAVINAIVQVFEVVKDLHSYVQDYHDRQQDKRYEARYRDYDERLFNDAVFLSNYLWFLNSSYDVTYMPVDGANLVAGITSGYYHKGMGQILVDFLPWKHNLLIDHYMINTQYGGKVCVVRVDPHDLNNFPYDEAVIKIFSEIEVCRSEL